MGHQFKLTEGIDDQRFRLIAFYEKFGTDRPFVQQIGRVLRNPSTESPRPAWIFHHVDDPLAEAWASYREYDNTAPTDALPRGPREFAAAQPDSQYLEGRFRRPFVLDDPDLHRQLLYPAVTRVYKTPSTFDLDEFTEAVADELEDVDCDSSGPQHPATNVVLHPYIAAGNSRFLKNRAFIEYSVGFTIYARIRNLLFFYDTHRLVPPSSELKAPTKRELLRLYPNRGSRLTEMSLTNTDVGPNSIRRRSFAARDIAAVAPDLSDASQLATSSRGATVSKRPGQEPKSVQRYVGLGSGRIRDGFSCEFDEYITWLQSLAAALRSSTAAAPVFHRYAQTAAVPKNTTPANILIDIDTAQFEILSLGEADRGLRINETAVAVEGGTFTLAVNDVDFTVDISWRDGRYVLRSPELDEFVTLRDSRGDRKAAPLISFLNREQAFRVVPEAADDSYSIYAGGSFNQPRLPIGPHSSDGVELQHLLTPVAELETITSEKGAKGSATGAGWEPGSLFALVDGRGKGTTLEGELTDLDLLVCDDMGTEIADWIAVRPGLVAAIHAKSSRGPTLLSASALHDVTAQAVKNLGSFQPTSVGEPKNLRRWDGPWNGAKIGTVDRRIRGTNVTGAEAWAQIRSELRDPRTSREVWLLIGNGLSVGALEAERLQENPKPEVIQILYSLQATWSTVSSVGAKLRVFCSR